ncbi:MAG TPA: cob(I)yrinic acid a,c-diamide adenosyltransferase [Candidatus Saccharimonadales bacterium]|nr:cob(I)yrinic acid a,c-diamide adenosyltransferase [Candidatus Saccharimonadales bacterium]
MAFEDYTTKPSVVIVYTGNSKGKTSASLGLMCRALGRGWKVAYIQFIKDWEVGEHTFIRTIEPLFKDKLTFYKGGKGFYNAGELTGRQEDGSVKQASEAEHQQSAAQTLEFALQCAKSGEYNLVICDEINNAVNDGLLTTAQLAQLLDSRTPATSLCLTGRNFPPSLLPKVDIATNMAKIKHHFDDKYLANQGIDY